MKLGSRNDVSETSILRLSKDTYPVRIGAVSSVSDIILYPRPIQYYLLCPARLAIIYLTFASFTRFPAAALHSESFDYEIFSIRIVALCGGSMGR
jgi:hypothetical protein